MNVTANDISETRKNLLVTVSGDEIASEEKTVLKTIAKQARVPGFRPGKAPENVIRQRYRKELGEELNRAVSRKVYQKALEDSELDVYSVVKFGNGETFKAGEEATVEITVDVTPPFELPPYKGIQTKPPSTEVSDKDVDEAIERLRRERADFTVVERAAAQGDYVRLGYEGTVDGEPVEPKLGEEPRLRVWGKAESTWEEAGTDEAKQYGVPAIVDGIVGMAAGDEKTIEHTFPEDFPVEDLRGKAVQYAVKVEEVRERRLPELDEAFLKSVQVESVEELKDRVLTDLESAKKREAENAKRQQIVDFLSQRVEFALPESAVESETQNVMGRIMVENMQRGIKEEEFEKNKEALHGQSEQIARRDLKVQLILTRIAKEEEIKLEEEDLQQAIMAMASRQRTPVEEFVRELQKDRSKLLRIQRQVLFGKTLDFLVKEAKVSEASDVAS
ncbi:MAG: trigger factor [Opitutales bacterium]|nr:trigger factor [Opitutales bacterium]